jgi:hypothetical protein
MDGGKNLWQLQGLHELLQTVFHASYARSSEKRQANASFENSRGILLRKDSVILRHSCPMLGSLAGKPPTRERPQKKNFIAACQSRRKSQKNCE